MDEAAQRLIGSWLLERWEVRYDDGRTRSLPFGSDAQGLLLYGADGWMSATMSRRERTAFAADAVRRIDDALKARAFDEYLAYVARRHVEHDVVVHEVRWSMNPVLIGTRQPRRMEFEDGRLLLAAEETSADGRRRVHAIAWRRA
jgi:hypothetical protein